MLVIAMWGWGDKFFDPAGGLPDLMNEVAAVPGVDKTYLYKYSEWPIVVERLKSYNGKRGLIGVSCGGNRATAAAANAYPTKINFMGLIQPSWYCGRGQAILNNVGEVWCTYSSWARTWGLGVYKPPLAIPPPLVAPDTSIYDGKTRFGNNGMTRVAYLYHDHLHPDDNDHSGVHVPICNAIKRIAAK